MGSSGSSGGEETVLDMFGATVWDPGLLYMSMCTLSCYIAYMMRT